ncbi:MAG: primosomal protein N' [Parcubacteria group bacterium]|nr:primosomal protein N' [Parcubacteria group bacterium]MCR4342843.1 primosomal protein N' [Patescibacteria group bacterium]
MKLITVVPITKGFLKKDLSYFTTKKIKPGSVVKIPLRKKTVPAIVISSKEIREVKSALKKSSFALKKISESGAPIFNPFFIDAVLEIAEYYASSLSNVLNEMTPKVILENSKQLKEQADKENKGKEEYKKISIFQGSDEERLKHYKSIIREEFAKDHSVLIILPTILATIETSKKLEKGIESHTIILHSEMPKKKLLEQWSEAISSKKPVLIISTGLFLSLPRKDLNTIIIDRESSSFYKYRTKPYIDIRKAAEIVSKHIRANLIYGDDIIRTEDYYNFKEESITPSHILSKAEQISVNMKKEEEKTKKFIIISEELKKMLEESKNRNEHTVLFINRRGYSQTTICDDCRKTITCKICDSPLVLHKENTRKTNFICHKCISSFSAEDRCPYCKSWRLKSLGTGVERVAEEVSNIFPKFKLFRIDSDVIKTKKQGDKVIEDFFSMPGSILIGTEMIFSYLNKDVDRAAIISLDALFTIPDFRISERIFHLLIKLRSLSQKTFLIQTRMPELNIFKLALRGDVSEFYRQELEIRQRFNYPPFKLLIKITNQNKDKKQLEIDFKKLEKELANYSPIVYSAFVPKIKGMHIMHALLKVDPASWPDRSLLEVLNSLSPAWRVEVDPFSLL